MENQLSIIEYSYYYALNNGNKSFVVPWVFILDEKIDLDILKKSIKKALEFFPRYTAKPVIKKDGNILLADNDKEPLITCDVTNVYLGSKESNNYLYRVIAEDNKLTFSIGHSLGDGYGMLSFCENVLYHYYIYKGENPSVTSKIYTKEDIENKINTMSLIEAIKTNYNLTDDEEKNISDEIFKSSKEGAEKFVLKLDDSLFSSKKFYREKIVFDSKTFMDIVHKYNATPITYFYMLLSQALIEKYAINDKRIASGIACDMRKYLNSRSQNNFGTLAFISYDVKWKDLPIDAQIKCIRDKFDKYLDIKWLKFMCKFFATAGDTSLDKFNINNYDRMMNELKNDYKYTSGGVFISNNGLIKFSDVINNHVLDFELINTPTKNDYEIDITTYKDKSAFELTLNGVDDGIFKIICDKLNSQNINAKHIKRSLIETDHVDALLFEKE